MGIKNLHKFLQKHAPLVYHPKSLSDYAGKKIAVDVFLYIYRFKSLFRSRWLPAFISMVASFKKNGIQSVFIYDSKSPDMKAAKIQERRLRRHTMEARIKQIKDELALYEEQRELYPVGIPVPPPPQILVQIMEKHLHHISKLLRPMQIENFVIDSEIINHEIARLEKQIVFITREDIQNSKDILDFLGVMHIDSEYEAETLCSQMCCRGEVDAVMSNDTDVLAYGTPLFLSNLNKDGVIEISIPEILEAIEMTQEAFRDLCIMCGTDYNDNIFRIGSEKAYRLLKKYGSIEEIGVQTDIDISVLNHVQVRALFTTPTVEEPFVYVEGVVDYAKFSEFAAIHNLGQDIIEQI